VSLILDALRKAEADRQRGLVPRLHSVALLTPSPPPPRDAGRRWLPLLPVLVLLAAAAGVWLALRPDARERHVAGPSPSLAPSPSASAPPTLPPVTAPAAAPPPLPLVVSAQPRQALPVAPPAPPPAPILTPVRLLAELPPEQRRELPALAVNGSVWSEQPSARFVVLDGQLLREGDSLEPGLVLVQLTPRAATLRWRDRLIEVPLRTPPPP
jgi:general secretion pathway protein B